MKRFILIGLDGAEPSLVEQWMTEGRLPALARLRREGGYCPLASTMPPATFPAWTTCVTGVNPGRHGIFDFTAMTPGQYALRFVNAAERQAPALWQILSAAGKRVAVLGVPATYPPEPVNGMMVSGFDSPVATGIDRSFVYPPECYETVRGWRFADFQESAIGPGWHAAALPKLLAAIDAKEAIAADILGREPWDFFMVVFGESDTVAHHFWMFHDARSPRFRPGFEDAILRVYQRLDTAVARLIAAAGPDVTVGIVSDHGFGGAGTGVIHINNWLAEKGYLTYAPARESVLKNAALRFIPEHWRGPLFRRFKSAAARAESHSRFAGIDWNATRAWSEELNYFPSIRLNLQGREPRGQVSRREYESVCAALCAELEQWAPVKKAWRREELYAGPCVEQAPDIVLELALEEGYSYSCLRSRGGPAMRRIAPEEYLGGKERGMNGNHRANGVLFLSKPFVSGAARMEDVAPTVLAQMGVPGPPMDGTPLLGDMETVEAVSYAASARPYSMEEERIIEERLRALGYFE